MVSKASAIAGPIVAGSSIAANMPIRPITVPIIPIAGAASAAVAGPIAGRLERLSMAERRWQQTALARLEALARAEASVTTEQWLKRRARAE